TPHRRERSRQPTTSAGTVGPSTVGPEQRADSALDLADPALTAPQLRNVHCPRRRTGERRGRGYGEVTAGTCRQRVGPGDLLPGVEHPRAQVGSEDAVDERR